MRKRKEARGPSVEGFTLASVLDAFAALGEAFEVAAEVRKGKEQIAAAQGRTGQAIRHGGAADAYTHAARQLLDLVAVLEEQEAPWEASRVTREEARSS